MEIRRQQAIQRKAEEEKAKTMEEERKMKEEAERRKKEREEQTEKRPFKPTASKRVRYTWLGTAAWISDMDCRRTIQRSGRLIQRR